jgi:hypothetical protein
MQTSLDDLALSKDTAELPWPFIKSNFKHDTFCIFVLQVLTALALYQH